ncbi:MAG: hypothetical protein ACKVHE_29315 [Planctomycetales bacterium]|jgi:hypothetical protein
MTPPLAKLLEHYLPARAVAPALILIYFAAALAILLFIGHQPNENPYMDVGANP